MKVKERKTQRQETQGEKMTPVHQIVTITMMTKSTTKPSSNTYKTINHTPCNNAPSKCLEKHIQQSNNH